MNKKAQEEIVGFVVVMVLVSVALLIMLGISLNKENKDVRSSSYFNQFLESSLEYTTNCSLRYTDSKLSELFSACESGLRCKAGRPTCEVLNDTITGLIEDGLQIGKDRPFTDYSLNIQHESNSTGEMIVQKLIEKQSDVCEGNIRGASSFIPASEGIIAIYLEVCIKS